MLKNMICIDTETGGLNPKECALCSVTLKKVNEDVIKTIYIKPTNLIYSEIAMDINGLTKDFLDKNGVSETKAIEEIKHFIYINKESPLKPTMLAHNAIFDIQFLNELFTRNKNFPFMENMHYHPMDTMIVMKFLRDSGLIKLNSVSLKECYRYFFNDYYTDAHTSEADVIATEKLYLKILEHVKRGGIVL